MQQMDDIQFLKGKTFFVGVLIIYTIQFGYIALQVIVRF